MNSPGCRTTGLWQAGLSNPALCALAIELRSALAGCRTVLDVGCGSLSPLRLWSGGRLVGLDAHQPSLEQARRNRTHDQYRLEDVRRLGEIFPAGEFDACVALDVIEHLTKDEGRQLLENMERIARKRVVVLTPSGFLPQNSEDGDLQEHRSGWTADEFCARGYRVTGQYGPKSWRGEHHRIKRRPRIFWAVASLVVHCLHTRSRPEKSAAIFCTRRVD